MRPLPPLTAQLEALLRLNLDAETRLFVTHIARKNEAATPPDPDEIKQVEALYAAKFRAPEERRAEFD